MYARNGEAAGLEAVVDTGATFSKLRATTASGSGLEVKYETGVELADGRVVKRGLALAQVEIGEVRRPGLIAIGEEEDKPVVGHATLEILGFKLSPISGKLERSIAIEYREWEPLRQAKTLGR